MNSEPWLDILCQLRTSGQPCVLLTVLESRGSTPRDSGTKMVVGRDQHWQTIGGGNLEYQCINLARDMLRHGVQSPRVEHFPLAARTGQCCGGMVRILLEPLLPPRPHIVVFGAGHVGKALINILTLLPCSVTWVDERPDMFGHVPLGVRLCLDDDPQAVVAEQPAGAWYLVMTHLHERDFALAEAVLRRGDHRYLGVIGSGAKSQRFRDRLADKGIAGPRLQTLRCPMGLPGVTGKQPAEIAVAVAAELVALWNGEVADQRSSTSSPE